MKNSPPVFLVGPVRSGSTLIRLMLDSHPQISNPGECDFLFDMVGDNGKLPPLDAYRKWLSDNRIFQAKQLKITPEIAYPDLMNSFIDQLRQEDQVLSMNIHRHFDRIPAVFPDARYIHLLRDPRDVARSCIGMGWAGHVYYGVDIWKEAEESWDRLTKTLRQDDYLEIKYEDLLEDIESGLTKICRFLGIDYSPQMLDYPNTTSYSLPDKKLSYQWRSKQSKRELQLIEGKVSAMLLARGYELSNEPGTKPGMLERTALWAKNKSYKFGVKIRRYGFALYLENMLANRFAVKSWRQRCQKRINAIDSKRLK